MLAYALAIAVGLSGLVLFSTAFFMSDIHRQDDFFWSAISLFYALVLWFCATRITGGVLLGQAAAVALLVSYNWQTLKLRKAIAYPEKAAELNNFSILAAVSQLLSRGKSKPQPKVTSTPPKVTEQEIAIPDTASTETPTTETPDRAIADKESPVTDRASADTNLASPTESNKTGFFGKFMGDKKQQSASTTSKPDTSSVANTNLNDLLDDAVVVETSTPLASLKDTKTKENTETTESVAQQPTTATETQTSDETTATPEPTNTVDTATASTSESSSTETIDTTPIETPESNTTEISVTETTTVTSSDDGEESVVEAVVIETSEFESETVETTTPESSASQAASDVDKSLDESDNQKDKPTNS